MASEERKAPPDKLPMLIIPGFMSSGLEVQESHLNPEWAGERVWMSIAKLGVASAHLRGAYETTAGGSRLSIMSHPDSGMEMSTTSFQARVEGGWASHKHLKNNWLEHLCLDAPNAEKRGIKVRAVPGLDGVDFLEHGALSHPTYVMGPVIYALQKHGYAEGKGLEAASYDWRLAPSILQERDGYFEKLADQIERMDAGEGVVLLAHSMGNKTALYFFEYIAEKRGRVWLDKHVHTWVAAGSPTIGAPAAAKALLLGDAMGLETFLSLNEAILMGRSFSSSPWLLPVGPQASRLLYVRQQGVLEVRCLSAKLGRRGFRTPEDIKLTVQVSWGVGHARSVLFTRSAREFRERRIAVFDENDTLFFAGPATLPEDATMVIYPQSREGVCCHLPTTCCGVLGSICCIVCIVARYLLRLAYFLCSLVREWANGRATMGIEQGETVPLSLFTLFRNEPSVPLRDSSKDDSQGWVYASPSLKCHCCNCARGYIRVQLRWRSFEQVCADWTRSTSSSWADEGAGDNLVCHPSLGTGVYKSVGLEDMLKLEGCSRIWREYYKEDRVYDDTGLRVPPLKRVVSFSGVNVRTPVAYALRLTTKRVSSTGHTSKSAPMSRFMLDDEAQLDLRHSDAQRLGMSGGIIYEEPGRGVETGDGTVPYMSLAHARNWRQHLDYREVFFDSVEHREMLSDPKMHHALLEVLSNNTQIGREAL